MFRHEPRRGPGDTHAANRVGRLDPGTWLGLEFLPAALVAEVVGMAVMHHLGLSRRRVHDHATDRITRDRFGAGIGNIGHHLSLHTDRCRLSSGWKVKA